MVKTVSVKGHWKQSCEFTAAVREDSLQVSAFLYPLPCVLSYSWTEPPFVFWRVSLSPHLPSHLSFAIPFHSSGVTNRPSSVFRWPIRGSIPHIMCFKQFWTPTIIQINLLIYLMLVSLVRWWASWCQGLYFIFFNFKTSASSKCLSHTINICFLTELRFEF